MAEENMLENILNFEKEKNATPDTYIVPSEHLLSVLDNLKRKGYDFLDCITAVDLKNIKGKEDKIAVVYNLSSSCDGTKKIAIKVFLPRDNPIIQSICSLYPTAEWHEREEYDLVGVIFEGHPSLKRIMLPEDWEGHPLRKDYKQPESWHGIDNRYFAEGSNPQRYAKDILRDFWEEEQN